MYTSLHTKKIIPDISENLKNLKEMHLHHYVFILVSQITKGSGKFQKLHHENQIGQKFPAN